MTFFTYFWCFLVSMFLSYYITFSYCLHENLYLLRLGVKKKEHYLGTSAVSDKDVITRSQNRDIIEQDYLNLFNG